MQVTALMLTADRPEMATRAIRSFQAQTYPNKRLLIYDTGNPKPAWDASEFAELLTGDPVDVHHVWSRSPPRGRSIGAMRNFVIERWITSPLICNWDDDDWSHPKRIEEQVRLLEYSVVDCVGYRSMVFWRPDEFSDPASGPTSILRPGEAYFYQYGGRDYALCTSLMYTRESWERGGRFKDVIAGNGEESHYWAWLHRIKLRTIEVNQFPSEAGVVMYGAEPRIIATIHGGNAVQTDPALRTKDNPADWMRCPEMDEHCRSRLECASKEPKK